MSLNLENGTTKLCSLYEICGKEATQTKKCPSCGRELNYCDTCVGEEIPPDGTCEHCYTDSILD